MLIKRGRFSVVLPACCERSVEAKMPYVYLNYGSELDDTCEPKTIDKAKPEWRCPNMAFEQVSALTKGKFEEYYKQDLSLKYCPFCGHELPKIVRVERSELKVHADRDGGYYCDTCNERNMNCECFPEVVLFDPELYEFGKE